MPNFEHFFEQYNWCFVEYQYVSNSPTVRRLL